MGKKHELMMISEPEAAAVYALKTTPPKGMKVGSHFVVCDAGGGTVDLIAYKVTSLYPLLVEESAVGTGGLCGSAFIDFRFEEHVKERLGFKRFNEMKQKKPKTWTMGLRYFEEFAKRTFNEDDSGDINIPMPGLPDDEAAGIDSGFLVMTTEQVKATFDPVIKQVIDLVQGQVDAVTSKHGTVAGIILVGGFGQSNHLYNKLKEHFNTAPPPPYSQRPTHEAGRMDQPGIEILQPLHAWTAVVRGAALRGVEGSVVEKRISRLAYGTSYATVFDAKKHPASDRYWSPLWEKWMVSDRMQWHVTKVGENYPHSNIETQLTRTLPRARQSPPNNPYRSTTPATSDQVNHWSSKTISSHAKTTMHQMPTTRT
jgi:molecular chaperone DnaK (HSP70)